MKGLTICLLLLSATALPRVKANSEILNILNTANDLTLQEVNALRPLFKELQKQYDAIKNALANEHVNNIVPWQKETTPESDIEAYVDSLDKMLKIPQIENPNSLKYHTKLPTFEELIADIPLQTFGMSSEQIAELKDLQLIMQDTLDDAQSGLNELVRRALLIESKILKLNKPKIVMYIYKALSIVFRYSAQLRRAAYCVYSHVPQLNDSLRNLNAGFECYSYTKNLIEAVESEVIQTVDTIKKNAFDLAKVYKKIAEKHSIVGKIITAILNIFKIMRDVRETLAVATKAVDDLENKLPTDAAKSVHCGLEFVDTLPFMLETAVNVTTCITYAEPQIAEYEFLLPEPERNSKLNDSK